MARYPTFEEYAIKGNFKDGLKRCNDLLKKNPNDVQLLTVRLRLLYALSEDAAPVIDQLVAIQPPIKDIGEIIAIEDAVNTSLQQVFPLPRTVSPLVSKLWDNAFKASTATNYRLDLCTVRFSRAVENNRPVDAQQALIQLKAFQPRNRLLYMAHAAYTQLLSSTKDDLQSRLALSLARKAVSERYDDDKSLDCRVPGQIFAAQNSEKDLESIADRRFSESKQVYRAKGLGKEIPLESALSEMSITDPATSSTRQWMSAEVASLKKNFTSLITTTAPPQVFIKFVSNAIRLFNTSVTSLDLGEYRGTADACFLAISGLVKMFTDTAQTSFLLHAAFMLEQLLQYNEYIHEARLSLVYLYMRLGLGSLAMRQFESLHVKEIQHDTIGHALFTRLSVIHPFQTDLTGKETFEPHDRLQKALGIYGRHAQKLAEMEADVLSHGQTGMIFDLHELREALGLSLPRRIFLLEHRRVARLTGKGLSTRASQFDLGPRKVANWISTTDNRDFDAAFNFGFNVEKALHSDCSSPPGLQWLLYALATDVAWSMTDTKQMLLTTDVEELLTELEKLTLSDPQDLAAAETVAGELAVALLKTIHENNLSHATTEADVNLLINAVNRLNIDTLVQMKDDVAERLRDHYVYVDVLRITASAARHIKSSGAESAQRKLTELEDHSKRHLQQIQQHARERAKSATVATVLDRLREVDALKESAQLFTDDAYNTFAESIVASAREGWEGVTNIALT